MSFEYDQTIASKIETRNRNNANAGLVVVALVLLFFADIEAYVCFVVAIAVIHKVIGIHASRLDRRASDRALKAYTEEQRRPT